ncbi:histidine kinase [Streptacidiphilus sp. N1-10]|uniref:histidine kinase n=1 Tax=Streptacidiphilus jeojiensis TaxID=3229225 RepID=A0ABV6XIH3_9ACTN
MRASPRFPPRRGDTPSLLRLGAFLVRVIGLAVVGVLLFHTPSVTPHTRVMQICVYAVLGLAVAGWSLLDLLPALQPHRLRLLGPVLGVVVAASGLGCALPDGDGLVAFAVVGSMVAGSELELLPACAVSGTGILAIMIGAIAFGDSVGTLLGYPLLLLVGLLLGRTRRGYQVQAEQSAALLAQYEQLQVQQRRTEVLDERARIAREIHDVLAHSLGALGIQVQVARAVLTDSQDIDKAVDLLGAAQRMVSEGLAETRRAVHALRSDQLPLDQEIARAADVHTRRHGTAVTVDIEGTPRPLPPDATLALLRIVQEALVNAAKHAPGEPVRLSLRCTEALTVVTVSNPVAGGAGSGDRRRGDAGGGSISGGYGLIGMRERLRLLDGTLTAGPDPTDRIWTVTAQLPHPDGNPAPQPGTLIP